MNQLDPFNHINAIIFLGLIVMAVVTEICELLHEVIHHTGKLLVFEVIVRCTILAALSFAAIGCVRVIFHLS